MQVVEHRRLRGVGRSATLIVLGLISVGMIVRGITDLANAGEESAAVEESTTTVAATVATTTTSSTTTTSTTTTTTTTLPPTYADPAAVRTAWGTAVQGLLTYRGNPTRTWLGTGPMPRTKPEVLWAYPDGGKMCGRSTEGRTTSTFCGTGWTGQPAVFERDGRTWVVFGAFDYMVHFVDAATGLDIIPPFQMADLASGNVTVDPDGYPLVYVGSRDNFLRVIAFDGVAPRELWQLNGQTDDRQGNDDWDAAPMILGDFMLEGGENSWFHAIRLNRGYDAAGAVTVAPEVVARQPGWDDELIAALAGDGADQLSIESSVMVSGNIAYFNTSGGLVQGWDLSGLNTGAPLTRVFRFWTGDDGDATIVSDEEGYLYIGTSIERDTARTQELGQLMKLDPLKPDNPVVWSINIDVGANSGTVGAPVVLGDTVIWSTKRGGVFGYDRATGAELWTVRVNGPVLSSPVYVDGVLLQGDGKGILHAFDLPDPRVAPTPLWTIALKGKIESTPAVWNGRIYIGDRAGRVYCLGLRQ